MSEAVEFLRGLGRYLSAAQLYDPGHRARQEHADEVAGAADSLLDRAPESSFFFLPGRVVFLDRPLRELDGWPWAAKLAEAGVRRIEMSLGLTRAELDAFLQEVAGELSRDEPATDGEEAGRAWRHIEFGALGVEKETPRQGRVELDEEAQFVGEIHEMAEKEGRVPLEETLELVRSLSGVMRGAQEIVVPFVRLKETDQYTAAHCLNVSILSMALAEAIDLSDIEVRAAGTAGLLHDVGKVKVPEEVLKKAGPLEEDEWAEMQRHPEHGCRILLNSGSNLGLAAMVAYEHHIRWGGGGYPELHYERPPLPHSRLIQVCDVYDALRMRRRYRKPMMAAVVVEILERNEQRMMDPEFIRPFVALLQRWDPATVLTEIRPEGEPEGEFEPA